VSPMESVPDPGGARYTKRFGIPLRDSMRTVNSHLETSMDCFRALGTENGRNVWIFDELRGPV
jgi:hypothetical protein